MSEDSLLMNEFLAKRVRDLERENKTLTAERDELKEKLQTHQRVVSGFAKEINELVALLRRWAGRGVYSHDLWADTKEAIAKHPEKP